MNKHQNSPISLNLLASFGLIFTLAFALPSCSDAEEGTPQASQVESIEPAASSNGGITDALPEGAIADMSLGSDDAPITIIEYASLTCSHCADFHKDVLPELKKNYIDTGRVKLIWRHFILNGPDMAASAIARCSGPERFFPMIDMFMSRQAEWIAPWQDLPKPGPDDTLATMSLAADMDKFVRPAGLPASKVEACLKDEDLQRSIMIGRQYGATTYSISGTPTIIINGKKYEGELTFDALNAKIRKLL